MSNNIFEELPSRKGGAAKPMGDAAASIEKKARQLVYDSRYEVKKMLAGKKADAAMQERMVLERIAKSTAVPAVKARARQMVSKKAAVAEDFIPTMEDAAATSIAKAMFKVFVEGVEKEVVLDYLEELNAVGDKKYKIRVTDPKTGNSYVRYGTREKITQLRSKGLKVELTEYGEPREGERKRGEETARATGGGGRKGRKKLDPVGKEDSDPDNDGNHNDPNDKYIMKRRAAIGAAIATRKEEKDYLPGNQERLDVNKNGKLDSNDFELLRSKKKKQVDEEFLADGTDSTEGKNKSQITGKGVDNYASGVIKISPEDGTQLDTKPKNVYAHTELEGEVLTEKAKSKAQQRFMAMVYSTKKGKKPMSPEVAASAKGMTKKEAKKFAKTKHKGLPEKIEESGYFPTKSSQRADEAKYNLRGQNVKPRTSQNQSKVQEENSSPEGEKKDNRGDYAKVNLVKNKLRAMGAKNPVVMVACEETVEEGAGLSIAASKALGKVFSNKRTSEAEATKAAQKNITDPVGFAIKGAVKGAAKTLGGNADSNEKMVQKRRPQTDLQKRVAAKTQQVVNQSYELDGNVISEREFDEPGEPRGTQRQKVDPEIWKRSMEQWKKLQPEIFDRKSGSGPVKGA
jgi:hypothetical protein